MLVLAAEAVVEALPTFTVVAAAVLDVFATEPLFAFAAALLIGFSAFALYYTYGLHGEPLECNCFGGIIASQLGVTTALRNLVLLIPVVIVAVAIGIAVDILYARNIGLLSASTAERVLALLRELGFDSHTFASAEDFLRSDYIDRVDCLILDIAMPGMTGPELQRELTIRGKSIPIIFITAQRDEALRPRLLKIGAVECLLKPFSEADLLRALDAAFLKN